MKNTFLTFILFILFGFTAQSQNITTTPLYPTANDEITLIFDATGTQLEGYNGQMYAHTGVGIEGGNNWQYVIGDWGNNNNQPELTSLGNDKWELLITPSLYAFYSMPAGVDVINLSFVFRSADAGMQTADLFIPIFSNELMIIYYWGEGDVNVLEGDTYKVHAVSPLADSMFLFIDDDLVYSTDQTEIIYETTVSGEYGYWNPVPVSLMAMNEADTLINSGTITVFPEPTIEERPTGIVDGINYIDNNTVILSLYAPEKEYVFVIGDFNNWEIAEDQYMKKTPGGERFWVQIDGLIEGQEYIYQYLVNGWLYIGDPYAEKVSDPWNDQYIGEDTYPGMLDYPEGQAEGIATVLQTAQEAYEWQIENFEPPAVEDMVVYELLIRDFTDQHTFQSLIDTMNYFQRLGVNVIELMPVNEFEGNISWGYNPNYYFAVDKYYGPKNKLKEFIDVCHANGIAVVIDMVLNHSFGTSPMVMLYWDYDNSRPAESNPWYNPIAKHDFNVGFDFNHESIHTRAFTKRVNDFWLDEFKVDGFRFDLSKGFTQKNTLGNVGLWGQYDQTRIDIWDDYSAAIWDTNPNAYVILEHFADNNEEIVLANNGMMLWGNSNHNYNEATMGWIDESDFSWISYQQRGWNNPHVVGYMESHDEERLQYKNLVYGRSVPGYNIQDSTIGLQRLGLAAAFFFTIPGPKMIWQFGEMGYDYTIDYNGRTGPKPIRWDYLDDWRREYLFHVYAALIDLKKNHDVFSTTDFSLDLYSETKSITLRGAGMNVVVVGNFGLENYDHEPDWPNTGTWYEFFTQSEYDVNSTGQLVNLDRGEYRIYTTEYIERPEWLNTSIDETGIFHSENIRVYPNPASDVVNFTLDLNEQSEVAIHIFDVMGKLVTTLEKGHMQAGLQNVSWNLLNDMNSGIYFALIRTGNKMETVKFTIE
jgi:pullulanase/glycogen debranching enzyme